MFFIDAGIFALRVKGQLEGNYGKSESGALECLEVTGQFEKVGAVQGGKCVARNDISLTPSTDPVGGTPNQTGR